jgi:hypothetical protein
MSITVSYCNLPFNFLADSLRYKHKSFCEKNNRQNNIPARVVLDQETLVSIPSFLSVWIWVRITKKFSCHHQLYLSLAVP